MLAFILANGPVVALLAYKILSDVVASFPALGANNIIHLLLVVLGVADPAKKA